MAASTAAEGLRRVGRGGAGNYYTQKDIDLAPPPAKNPETSDTDTRAPGAPQSGPAYSKAGRGGAGNFYEPDAIAESIQKEKELQKERNAVSAAAARPYREAGSGGLSGRGGAGNWSSTGPDPTIEHEQARKKADIEATAAQEVDAGLSAPPRAHLGPPA